MCLGEVKADILRLYTVHISVSEAKVLTGALRKPEKVCFSTRGGRGKRPSLGFADGNVNCNSSMGKESDVSILTTRLNIPEIPLYGMEQVEMKQEVWRIYV